MKLKVMDLKKKTKLALILKRVYTLTELHKQLDYLTNFTN